MRLTLPVTATALVGAVLCAAIAAARAQTVSLTQSGEATTVAVGDAATLPGDFPDDVYLPQGARLARVERTGDSQRLEFTATPAPEALAARFTACMAARGWTPAQVRAIPGAQVMAWEKDARAVVVALAPESGGTRLRVQLLPRRRGDAGGP